MSVFILVCFLGSSHFSFGNTYTAGETLKSYGAISGDQYGNLNEGMKLTRGEMAVVMASLNGKTAEAKNFKLKTTFTDVPQGAWYGPYVAYAEAMNWTKGIGGGKYGPMLYVTNKEAAAFLLNTLGKKYNYNSVIEEAKKIGITNGLSTEGDILRGNLFKAMIDALKVIPEGEKQTLGVQLGYFKDSIIITPEVSVKSVEIGSTKALKVNFNSALSETGKLTFSVKKLGISTPVTVTWNDIKNVAYLTYESGFTLGIYEVVVTEGNKEIYNQSVQIAERQVSRIEITSPEVHVVSMGLSQMGFISYVVYDQYGSDITNDGKASGLVFNIPQFEATGQAGTIIVKTTNGNYSMFSSDTMKLTVIDSRTGISKISELPLKLVISSLSDFTINSSGVTLQNTATAPVYISCKAVDSFGLGTESYDIITSGLVDMNYSGSTDTVVDLIGATNNAGLKAEIVRSSEDQNKALIKITPGNVSLTADTYVSITASTKSGKTTTILIKVLK